MGFYTVDQNERAVKTSFGRAERVGTATTLDDPISQMRQDDELPPINARSMSGMNIRPSNPALR